MQLFKALFFASFTFGTTGLQFYAWANEFLTVSWGLFILWSSVSP